jgi:hypothetical protein
VLCVSMYGHKYGFLSRIRFSENLAVFEGLLNRLYARKHYLLALTYFAQPQCEWYHKADLELQELTKLLTSKDAGSILDTQNLGKDVEGGRLH